MYVQLAAGWCNETEHGQTRYIVPEETITWWEEQLGPEQLFDV